MLVSTPEEVLRCAASISDEAVVVVEVRTWSAKLLLLTHSFFVSAVLAGCVSVP